MAFVNEYISDEDKKRCKEKYGPDYWTSWTIDRERGIFLTASGINQERTVRFKLYFEDGGIVNVASTEGSTPKAKDGSATEGFITSYDLAGLHISENLATKFTVKDIVEILSEAITKQAESPKRTVKIIIPPYIQDQIKQNVHNHIHLGKRVH